MIRRGVVPTLRIQAIFLVPGGSRGPHGDEVIKDEQQKVSLKVDAPRASQTLLLQARPTNFGNLMIGFFFSPITNRQFRGACGSAFPTGNGCQGVTVRRLRC